MAIVTTDKLDYAPGETVNITADGFTPGSTIEFEIKHVTDPGGDGIWGTDDDVFGDNSGSGHEPWVVIADDNGSIQTEWYVNPDDSLNETFTLTATGSGADGEYGTDDDVTATTVFTDEVVLTFTGVNVTHDESSDYQNAQLLNASPTDFDDNDIDVSLHPVSIDFSDRLIELGAADPNSFDETNGQGVALSGYDGSSSNSGLDVFTIGTVEGEISNLSLTGADGIPLEGLKWTYTWNHDDNGGTSDVTIDVTTLDGVPIFLYTDSVNDNIVVGRKATDGGTADPTGEIVIAVYLQETQTDGITTGGKLEIVQYEPLSNPNPNDPDDPIDLTDLIYVSIAEEQNFDIANTFPGQNLFIMFSSDDRTIVDGRIEGPTIVATGLNPANESEEGVELQDGDTINTSNAAGSTTIGSNSQMLVHGDGIVYTYVTGAKVDFTDPDLDQNEADIEAYIDFIDMYNSIEASFDVVQLQSGKSAMVKISAYSTDAEPGIAFVDGYSDDDLVTISSIEITEAFYSPNKDITPVIEPNGDGTYTISGIQAGDSIKFTTDGDHNRVSIENAGSGKGQHVAAFDIGPIALTQVNTATEEIGSKIIFEDDGPGALAAASQFVDEDGLLPDGNDDDATGDFPVPDTDGDGNEATAGFSLSGLVAPGTDAPVTFSLSGDIDDINALPTLTSKGAPVVYNVSGNTLTAYVEEGTTSGYQSGVDRDVFTFVLSGTNNGDSTFTLLSALDHPTANTEDDLEVALTSVIEARDADGDLVPLEGYSVIVDDDSPIISTTGTVPTLTTDDTDIPDTTGPTDFSGLFNTSFGADGFKDTDDDDVEDLDAVAYTLGVSATGGVDSGLVDTLSGDKIYLYLEGTDVVGRVGLDGDGGADVAGAVAFTISVNAGDAGVTLVQNRSVVHDDSTDHEETGGSAAGLSAANLVTLTATITDGDGDSDDVTEDIGNAFKFEDDGPSITLSSATVPTLTTDDTDITDSDGPTDFSGLFTEDFGEDGFKDSDDNDVEDANAVAYTLGVSATGGVDSGLVDTLSGDKIYLYLEGTDVVGRVGLDGDGGADVAGAVAFTISVNAGDAGVTLVQDRSVVHDDSTDHEETGGSAAGLSAANLVTLTATITDGDGDSDDVTEDIGNAFKFEDDGPSITLSSATVPTLTTDDTDITDSDGPTDFSGLFTEDFGEDGFKDSDDNDVEDANAVAYTLGVSATGGVDSGLVDTLSGDKIYLYLEGTDVVGRVGLDGDGGADVAGAVAFTISVNAGDAGVTLVQDRSVVHDDSTDHEETGGSAAGLSAANLVTLTATITDGDGDSDDVTEDIGNAFKFEDDGPSITLSSATVPTLTTDDTDITDSDGPTDFSGLFTEDFGEDGFKDSDDNDVEDANAVAYTLGVSATGGVDSGLVDTLSGDKIYLYLEGTDVVGRVGQDDDGGADVAGAVAFTISVNAGDAGVTLVQNRSVVHDDSTDHEETGGSAAGLSAANLVTLTATITDGDGDSDDVTEDIGNAFKFEDDGPSITLSSATVPTLTTDDTDITDSDGPTDFSGLFTEDFGEDGFKDSDDNDVEDANAVAYTLGVSATGGVDSGLVDTLSGDKIYLYLEGTDVVGRVGLDGDGGADVAGAVAFTISVNAGDAGVTLVQDRSVVHDDSTDHEETGGSAAGLSAANLVTLTATITDGDGDSDDVTEDIGNAFKFEDDGPSITLSSATVPTLTTDDTDITDSDGPTDFSGLFTEDFGEDGFKDSDDNDVEDANAVAYTLGVSATGGVDSGLVDTLSGDKIYLYLEGTDVVGRVGQDDDGGADVAGAVAFTISVNAGDAGVTLVQDRSVVHDDSTDHEETGGSAAGLSAANLVTLTATITDGDGDSDDVTEDIGNAFKFEDDGPSITLSSATVPTLTTDDTDITDSDGPTDFSGLFTEDFGEDGFKDSDDNDVEDANAVAYTLGVSATGGVDSGLVDTLSGDKIYLYLEGTDVVGRVGQDDDGGADVAGAVAFTISVNAGDAGVTLVQNRSVVHDDSTDHEETGGSAAGLSAANLVTLTATITDGDGDSDDVTEDIGNAFKFEDDGPSITLSSATVPTLTTDDTDITDSDGPTDFSGLFTEDFGEDGFKDSDDNDVEDANAVAYTLGVSATGGVDSGLVDTLSGDKIYLYLEGTDVVGRVGQDDDGGADVAGAVAFTISVNAGDAGVTLVQNRSVVHDDSTDHEETGGSAAGLSAANLVTLTATITDGDGDSDDVTEDIGNAFKFEDDGPSITLSSATVPTLTTDDTDITDSDGPTDFSGLFTEDFGEDGFKDSDDNDVEDANAVAYTLGVSATGGVDSGLVDTLSGDKIYLYLEGTDVVGRVGLDGDGGADVAGAVAFTISVNAGDAGVTLVQDRSVVHDDSTDHEETGGSAAGLSAANLVTLTATITDGDGDSDDVTEDIGNAFKFEDDGPTLDFGNLVGTGTINPQYGYWDKSAGTDQMALLGITLNSFNIVNGGSAPGTSYTFNLVGTPTGDVDYLYEGSLTGDFDNNDSTDDTTVDFTLSVFSDGRYEFDLEQGFGSSVTFLSSDGSLDAGGPDSVRTLLIPEPLENPPVIPSPSEEIVFFGVEPTTSSTNILDAIGLGVADPTEADIEFINYDFIADEAMNVSTSGIGIGNNNLDGDGIAGITSGDESFVINPESLNTSLKVYIDNSQPYDTTSDQLYYSIYYENGTVSGPTLVTDADLTDEQLPGDHGPLEQSFVINWDGVNLIDAVQLTMGLGVVKIPVIEFTTGTESLVSDVELDLTATITDGDDDTAISDFAIDLFANEVSLGGSVLFDFELEGTGGDDDAFNIDLAVAENTTYQVSGFDISDDSLVFLGDDDEAAPSIDNSGANSIVTIESDGFTTEVTVIGVDLTQANIVFEG